MANKKGASHQSTPGGGRRERTAGRSWRPLLIHGSGARRRRPPRSAAARLAQPRRRGERQSGACQRRRQRCPLLEPLGWGWKLCALRGSLRLLAATAGESRRRRRRAAAGGLARRLFQTVVVVTPPQLRYVCQVASVDRPGAARRTNGWAGQILVWRAHSLQGHVKGVSGKARPAAPSSRRCAHWRWR